MSKLIPTIHKDIALNCATPVDRDFEKILLCFVINKHTQDNQWPPHIFELIFADPPREAIPFTEVKLNTEILTHKIYYFNNTFYVVRNF